MKQEFTTVWLDTVKDIINSGKVVSPRGQHTRELPQRTITVNMNYPVLTIPSRKLSYKFMAAEAYWILSGDNRVKTIAPFNERISQFSDDGQTFFGAYGPKVVDQLTFVVDKLREDNDSRQAGLTIWRENPPATKDVPCTIAIFFNIRNAKLNCHVFMRSSDAWLGLPYDVFNFSMLTHLVCGLLNNVGDINVRPGGLYLTAASSHLYFRDINAAVDCIHAPTKPSLITPDNLYRHPDVLMSTLDKLRFSSPGDPLRWWEG